MGVNKYIEQIASLLNIHIGKCNFNEDLLCSCIVNDKNISGVINLISSLLAKSKSNLSGTSALENVEIQQWIEYAVVYAIHIDSNSHNLNIILNELNEVLSTKTYLVAYKLTIADVLLYYILLNAMVSLSYSEKQKYMNVSRWFDNLQQDTHLRKSNMFINFNINYLASVV